MTDFWPQRVSFKEKTKSIRRLTRLFDAEDDRLEAKRRRFGFFKQALRVLLFFILYPRPNIPRNIGLFNDRLVILGINIDFKVFHTRAVFLIIHIIFFPLFSVDFYQQVLNAFALSLYCVWRFAFSWKHDIVLIKIPLFEKVSFLSQCPKNAENISEIGLFWHFKFYKILL